MTVRYGIISTAQIVPRFVAGIRESDEGEVTAIASRTLDRAQKMAEKLAIPTAYGSYQELIEDDNVDIVYVATYNRGHYEVAKEAILAGKHVLVEKPFTLTWDEADELFHLAKEQAVFLMEAQKALFLPTTNFVKEKIQSGALGNVQYIRSTTAYPNVDHISWFHSIDAGGGAMRSSGSYPVQYMLYMTDSEIAEAAGTVLRQPKETDTQCDVSILFENQVQGNIFVTTHLDIPSELAIYGDKGKIVVPYFWKASEVLIEINGETQNFSFDYESEFVYEINHVNECLKKGLIESPVMTKELTLQSVELADQLYAQWLIEG